MYDMHYDLLTILYFNFKDNNSLANKQKVIEDCKKIYNNNILGGLINLYFMSEKEMKEELGIDKEELYDVTAMFIKSIKYLELLKDNDIIPNDINFLYSIEGCDYIKSNEELEVLYNLGLRSILPVWNEKNKFGSGNRSDLGLTDLGIELIKKAIDLGIIIDVSHANQKTFNDIIDVIKEEQINGKEPIVIASHSNVRSLCDVRRNLTDEQLIKLKEVGGYIGLLTNGNFLSLDNEQIDKSKRQENFIKHLKYIYEVIGFSDDRILLSTDDMNFNPDPSYHNLEAFKLDSVSVDMREKLSQYFETSFIDKIMVENAENIINKVFKNKLNKKQV